MAVAVISGGPNPARPDYNLKREAKENDCLA